MFLLHVCMYDLIVGNIKGIQEIALIFISFFG